MRRISWKCHLDATWMLLGDDFNTAKMQLECNLNATKMLPRCNLEKCRIGSTCNLDEVSIGRRVDGREFNAGRQFDTVWQRWEGLPLAPLTAWLGTTSWPTS